MEETVTLEVNPNQDPLYFTEQNISFGRPFEETRYYRIFCILILLWFFSFMYPIISITNLMSDMKAANGSVSQGSLYNQAVIGIYALLGLLNFRPALRLLNTRDAKWLFSLLGLYLAWSLATFSWTIDQALSTRRFITLLMLLIGSVGLGAGFYGRIQNGMQVLARHVMYAASLCGMWLVIRLATGSQDITDPRWTMKYSFEIEPYAYALGYGIVAVFFLFRNHPWKRSALALFYLLLLIALKGRTLILGVFSAAAIVYSRMSHGRVSRTLAMVAGCSSAAILLDLVTGGNLLVIAVTSGYDVLAPWLPYISIGDGLRNLTDLSGRRPLWNALLPHAAEHLFTGHGFGAFWTPDRFSEIYAVIRWRAVVAHNGFLDEILATGVIGLVLLMAFWISAMWLAWRRGSSGYVVFAWLLLFLSFNTMLSIIQTYFQLPMFVSVTALALILVEDSAERCQHCGAKLIKAQTLSGELISVHP